VTKFDGGGDAEVSKRSLEKQNPNRPVWDGNARKDKGMARGIYGFGGFKNVCWVRKGKNGPKCKKSQGNLKKGGWGKRKEKEEARAGKTTNEKKEGGGQIFPAR